MTLLKVGVITNELSTITGSMDNAIPLDKAGLIPINSSAPTSHVTLVSFSKSVVNTLDRSTPALIATVSVLFRWKLVPMFT